MENDSIVYEQDFFQWLHRQADLLRRGDWAALDTENLCEEIEAMGRRELRSLRSRMAVLLQHLLKLKFQPDYRGNKNSWFNTVREQRRALADLLRDSPSLTGRLRDETWFGEVWADAAEDAAAETGLPESVFPCVPIWTVEQVLDKSFLP